MRIRFLIAAALIAAPATAFAGEISLDATAHVPGDQPGAEPRDGDGIPDQLDREQRDGYRAVFAAIRSERWDDAKIKLDAMKPGPLHAIARAELYTARNSPKVELAPLMALLAEAPELPQAEQLARLAKLRGATETPVLPAASRLVWFDAAPIRQRASSIRSDNAATEVAILMQPHIKDDNGPGAEEVVSRFEDQLTPEARTEWLQKTAFIYYLSGDDANARRVAAKAQLGEGEWASQADWVQGLAAWRQDDCNAAGQAFERVASRATDTELRSAGLYWGSRADMACGRPDRIAAKLQSAAQYGETFYGLLAKSALAIEDKPVRGERVTAEEWKTLERRPNIRVAAALVEIGENGLAAEVIRHQAKLGSPQEHAALTRLAGRLSLASTELWLSHNGPAGTKPLAEARYPAPNWTPDGGWRVDKALVFAHTLQESKFMTDVKSSAGAMGLMQVKQGAAIDVSRRRGVNYAGADLTNPAINMEIGQSYLEQLRDLPFTQGLLPKVIAAYNAGPTPVEAWNSLTKDKGDPLLYIESIPYWETRGYVMTVLRNYWMYENREGRPSVSREALAQGMWPKFPGMPGAPSVKLSGRRPSQNYGGQ